MQSRIEEDRIFLPCKHAPGGLWMTKGIDPGAVETFSFHHYASGELMHFHVAKLWMMLLERKPPFEQTEMIETALTEADVDFVVRQHGIEESGLRRVTGERLHMPGLLADMPDNTQIVVDGNHRHVQRWRSGLRAMGFFVLSQARWRLVLLDIPEEYGRMMTGGA